MQFGYTNPNDTEGLMDLLSTGAQMILFITGRGSVTGSPLAPVVKITGNTQTYERMRDDMDFNAGRILGGDLTLDGAAQELESLVARVAGGEQSRPEALGHREYFLMYKHQDTPSLAAGCRA
jgi:altronate hydrolase